MWNNSLWEQENQEKLKADYFERLRAGTSDTYVYPIRRIICGGCGKVFYTTVHSKKFSKSIFLSKPQAWYIIRRKAVYHQKRQSRFCISSRVSVY